MTILISAVMAVLTASLIVSIFVVLIVAFVALWGLKMAHRANSRRVQNAKGKHIRR